MANALMQAMGKAKPNQHYAVRFLGSTGKPLNFHTFMQTAQAGQRFVIATNDKTGTAVWKLLPPGVATADSLSIVPPPPTKKVGSPLPTFTLSALAGGTIANADFKGTPFLIDFFFADCKGCIQELPLLDAYAQRHPQQRVLMVTFDDKGTAKAFVEKWHPAWPVAYAAQKFDNAIGINVYPTMALIDADGRVAALHVGAFGETQKDAGKLAAWVAAHLGDAHAGAAAH
ncbi:MAG TPA: TlpA disulfide reductase family protein [Rhodanobacteraceae bacterium]|nr:TlpA disulfide reductase family protein [Rhodanobacteraceae bacterium]